MLDMAGVARRRGCSTWQPAPGARRSPRPGASGPAVMCWPPTSPATSSPSPSAAHARPGLRNVETRVVDGEQLDVRAGHVRRGHLARRLHLLPRPARRVRRHAARAQAGRPVGRDRLLDPRGQRLLLDAGVGHPPPGAAAGAGARASPAPSASAPPGSSRRPSSGPASPTSRRGGSPLPCGCRPRPTSSASRASPSGPCTRCSRG